MNANEPACEVPVVELLEAVPKDARFVQEEDFSSTYHPVGRLCHEAATMLRQQQAELDAFKLQYYNTGYSIQLRDKDETIRQQQAEIEEVDYEAISWALHKLHNFGVTQNNMDNALMADRLELMLRKAKE